MNHIGEIKTILKHALNIDESEILHIHKLGGWTNNNYKIVLHDDELALRIPRENSKGFISRKNEKINSKITEKLGLNCENIYFNENSGVKITKFIKDGKTFNIKSIKEEGNIKLVAKALNTLHISGFKFNNTFNPVLELENYERILRSLNGEFFKDYGDIKTVFLKLKNILDGMKIKYVPCHMDPVAENFIKSGERLYLIDWEYSANYDAIWDVVSIIMECGFSKHEEDLLLKSYFKGNITKDEHLRIKIHSVMQDILWAMWGLVKEKSGEKEMLNYSKERYDNAKLNINKFFNFSR